MLGGKRNAHLRMCMPIVYIYTNILGSAFLKVYRHQSVVWNM